MDDNNNLKALLGETDIYLIDQLLKGRYQQADKILDAGCGQGRNMYWFLQNNFDIVGIDRNEEVVGQLRSANPTLPANRFLVSTVEEMPFPDNHFDHIISSAVLHFATNTIHFKDMLGEMVRVLKPGASLFIRMTSAIGIEHKVSLLADGVYHIPDGSERFLLTRQLLNDCLQQFAIALIEPLKTVNVDDIRCMSTLVLKKK